MSPEETRTVRDGVTTRRYVRDQVPLTPQEEHDIRRVYLEKAIAGLKIEVSLSTPEKRFVCWEEYEWDLEDRFEDQGEHSQDEMLESWLKDIEDAIRKIREAKVSPLPKTKTVRREVFPGDPEYATAEVETWRWFNLPSYKLEGEK